MNLQEYAQTSGDDNCEGHVSNCNGVYSLVTELSRHLLYTRRSLRRMNVRSTYDDDAKPINSLRTKAYEILLKKGVESVPDQDREEFQETDPLVELQKYAFVLKLGFKYSYNASLLEDLLEELEELLCDDVSILPILQLLIQLKTFDAKPEPIMNIFYCGRRNPVVPCVAHSTNRIPMFQTYPVECFLSSDKFAATLETQWFHVRSTAPTNIRKEINFLRNSIKSKAVLEIESTDLSVACGFMSNHAFDKISSHTLLRPSERFTTNMELDLCILQNNMAEDECEDVHVFSTEVDVATNSMFLPIVQTNVAEDESVPNRRKSFDPSVVDQSNDAINIWNRTWSQHDFTDSPPALDLRTWEHFGERQTIRETMFITETPASGIHLEKIIQMNNLPLLLSEKITRFGPPFKEIPPNEFINDLRSMLLGVESDSFEYRHMTGFALRRRISVNGASIESLERTCQEAINWGNCFRYLTDLVASKSSDSKLPQEGQMFKAMCTNIKELLLYYQAALLRIFTSENRSERLLKTFVNVRPVATLITKVAKFCRCYKGSGHVSREGCSILTRIYNEAIKVTDNNVALVFYSLLKSCCDVYFRFLQKWIFEGICDDVYGEFMIKTRPLYLRNRSHKFWTKSFSIRNDAVPGFLSDIADSILQCGKTVTLLRTCDSKNPVCHVCVTEQPEIRVCLSAISVSEQTSRCREYERKGKTALGPVLSLSTYGRTLGILAQERKLAKEMSDVANVANTERDATVWRTRGERLDVKSVKVSIGARENILASPQGRSSSDFSNSRETKKVENELSGRTVFQVEGDIEGHTSRDKSRCSERASILDRYQLLANDISKRRIRSQWRVNRMKFYDKRIDALSRSGTKSDSKCEQTETSNNSLEMSTSIQDENKNYTETPSRTFETDTVAAAVTVSLIEHDQRDSTRYLCSSNDNGNYDLRTTSQRFDAVNARTLRTELPTDRDTPNDQLNDQLDEILKCLPMHWTDRSSAIERPTSLDVRRIDNATEHSESSGQKMTPNNNQLDTEEVDLVAATTNEEQADRIVSERFESYSCSNQQCSLQTPMSCTTDDNFSSPPASPFTQTPLAQLAVSLVPNYTRGTSRSPPPPLINDSTFSNLFQLTRDETKTSNASATTLSIDDVEIIDHISLQAYLQKSIRIPLGVQSRLINNAVIKYFLKENNLLSHLHSLRSYFFLLNGEFAKSLTDSLYARLYEISIPVELFNSAMLTNLLERALCNSFNDAYVNSELLSLSATDKPAELHISDPTALDCLSLNYKINWPLNIILDETVMQQYGKVFKFLVTSGRVSWVLQEDFSIMKRERNAIASEQYHKLQLYRHSMTQFMNALHNYLTCSVLHASWTEFEKDLENSATIDHIYLSHINYIKRILSRCMLNSRGEKVRVCLNNIFKVILKFHNRIRSQSWITKSTGCMVHPNFKKLEQMYRAFCELRGYMAHVAFKLATSGYQPHLMHFLNALNINQAYDLTVKTSRSSVAPP